VADAGEVRVLGFPEPGRAAFFLHRRVPLARGQVRVRTRWSALSAGTELASYKGSNPMLTRQWDGDRAVFLSGDPISAYPVEETGYMAVGEVEESRQSDVLLGTTVALAAGHASEHVVGPDQPLVPVPEGLDPVLGVYLAQMGPICANGLLHAAVEVLPSADQPASSLDMGHLGDLARRRLRQPWRLPRSAVTAARMVVGGGGSASSGPTPLSAGVGGRHVLVTGAGVVGLLTALLAQEHGAEEVLVADPDPYRRGIAEALGLEALDTREDPAWEQVKDRWKGGWGDHGADVAFQCRGRTADLADALRSLRPQGVVVDLAFYQEPAIALRLGDEFHHNSLTIRCAQIGRVPLAVAGEWDRSGLVDATAELLASRGSDIRRHLITDVVPIDEAPVVLAELAARRRHAGQVVFDHGEAPGPPVGGVDAG